MAERNPPTSISAGSHTSENDRLTYGGLTGASEGVADSAAMKVSAPGGRFARVAPGWAAIKGTSSAVQGTYFVYNDANLDLAITPDGSNPRIVVIVAELIDAAYIGGVDNKWQLRPVHGTPSGSPVEPALPTSAIRLGSFQIAANGAAPGVITDRRKYATAIGGSHIAATSADLPTVTRPGMMAFQNDGNKLLRRNSVDDAWIPTGNVFVNDLATAPSPTFAGAMLIDPTTGLSYWYDGTAWRPFGQTARSWTVIDDQLLAVDTGVITFASIPQTFAHLKLLVSGRSTNGVDIEAFVARMNSDAAANYSSEQLQGNNVAVAAQHYASVYTGILGGMLTGATANAGRFMQAECTIQDYRSTLINKVMCSVNGGVSGASHWVELFAGMWFSTAAITRIDLLTASLNNWKAGSRATLLGIR